MYMAKKEGFGSGGEGWVASKRGQDPADAPTEFVKTGNRRKSPEVGFWKKNPDGTLSEVPMGVSPEHVQENLKRTHELFVADRAREDARRVADAKVEGEAPVQPAKRYTPKPGDARMIRRSEFVQAAVSKSTDKPSFINRIFNLFRGK